MGANSFINFFGTAVGESIQKGKENWIEIQAWDWEVEAATNVGMGGGGAAGKATAGKLKFEHFFDSSSTVILAYICTGKTFPKLELQMLRNTGKGTPETYFTMTMENVVITKVSNAGNAEGRIVQQVELAFKTVKIDYRPQDPRTGSSTAVKSFNWNIPANTATATG